MSQNADIVRLGANQISDISLLALLPRLAELYLSDNVIEDISPLKEKTGLRKIGLSGNPISDASPLSGLKDLENVFIDETGIATLEWIVGLANLSLLFAEGNDISDIAPLAGLENLGTLRLNDNAISDLSVFDGGLKHSIIALRLADNELSNISPLAGMDRLSSLDLSGNEIEDISPLASAVSPHPSPIDEFETVALTKLYLHDNRIRDISILAGLGTYPTEVTLWDNQIEDISPLVGTASAARYEFWDFSNNRISDLSPLASFEKLNFLDVSNNDVEDLSPLAGKTLMDLWASGNRIHDLSPLLEDSVYGGELIDLTDNRVVSVNPLSSLAKVSPNAVPLYVFLMGNPLGEFALAEDLPFLCGLERTEIYYGDGETCAWNIAPSITLPAYSYPPDSFSEAEPEKPVECDAASRWLTGGALPDDGHGGSEFVVVDTVAEEPLVEDIVTGLVWRRCSEGQTWDGETCAGNSIAIDPEYLDNACSDSFGGYEDWRKPTISELNTLVKYDVAYPGPVIDAVAFPNTYPGNYWTTEAPPYLWLNFYNGAASLASSMPGRMRCVRGGSLSLPDLRFSVASETTVLDTATGLEWQRCAAGQTVAGESCDGIGKAVSFSTAESLCTGEYRLPTVSELFSLTNPCAADPSTSTAAFPNSPPALFWTNTRFPDVDEKRWAVYFGVSSTEPLSIDSLARVRCVR